MTNFSSKSLTDFAFYVVVYINYISLFHFFVQKLMEFSIILTSDAGQMKYVNHENLSQMQKAKSQTEYHL